MSEPNKPDEKEPTRPLANSSFLRLPWRQVLRKKVLLTIAIPLMLAALYSVPQMAAHAYGKAGFASALVVTGMGLLLFALVAAQLIFAVAVFWGLALDIASAYRDIRAGLKKLPAAWASFRESCSRFRAGCGRAWRRIAGVPAAVAGMTAEQRAEAIFMTSAFAVFGLIAYLGWTPAAHLAAKLPRWLLPETDFMGTLFIDILGSTFVFAFVMPILTTVLFRLFPGMRPRRSDRTKKS